MGMALAETGRGAAGLTQGDAWAILETTPAMIWLGDAAGHCVYLNAALREFWGVAELSEFSWGATLHPEDGPLLAGPYAEAMATQTPFRVEARYRRADGTWRWLLTEARPHFDAAGVFQGMVGVNRDVTERREAEAALRRSRDQLEFAIEAAGEVGTWVWDVQRDAISADRQTWCGVVQPDDGPMATLAQFVESIHPEDRARVTAAIWHAVETGEAYRCEFRLPREDGLRWITALGRCERDARGQPTIFAGLTVDVTERREREEATLMLSRELSHRLKNAFGIIQSLVAQTAKRQPGAAAALHDLAGRIQALGRAHLLSLPDQRAGAVAPGLRALAEVVLAPYGTGAPSWDGPDLDLTPEAMTPFALILHELATNSAKHGALGAEGRVAIALRAEEGSVVLEWAETGGPPVTAPRATGFGSTLIAQSAASLRGEARASWLPGGLVWTLALPVGRLRLRAQPGGDEGQERFGQEGL